MARWASVFAPGALLVVLGVLIVQLSSVAPEPTKPPTRPTSSDAGALEAVKEPEELAYAEIASRAEASDARAYRHVIQEWIKKLDPQWGQNLIFLEVSVAAEPGSYGLSDGEDLAQRVKELAGVVELRKLDLGLTQVRDAELKHLGELKQVEALDLLQTPVTDAGLRHLAGLTQLRTLGLRGTKVTGAGLADLAGLRELRTLDLAWTPVTDVGLKGLAGLTQLQELDLTGTKVTKAGLRELAGLLQFVVQKQIGQGLPHRTAAVKISRSRLHVYMTTCQQTRVNTRSDRRTWLSRSDRDCTQAGV